MSLVDWRSLPVRVKRSRKRLYGVLADEYNLVAWMELPIEVKRSKKKLYDFIANELNIDSFEELPIECRRSTRLMYAFIRENGGGGSTPTLTVVVTDGADPITGATVTVDGDSETTGSDGKATFTLEYGDYEATISASGYVTKTEELAFRSNHKNFEIELEAETPVVTTGTVTVTTVDSESNPLENADVFLWDTDTFTDPTHLAGAVYTSSDGTGTLKTLDGNYEPTETDAEIDFGTYYFNVEYTNGDVPLYYTGEFVVDSATETVTLTLTEQ